jgi:hypothetical protein
LSSGKCARFSKILRTGAWMAPGMWPCLLYPTAHVDNRRRDVLSFEQALIEVPGGMTINKY